ncbi:MAG TPA: DNA-binding protein [Treponema sp.]|nr:DNA-binding protein [Treponema sp.]
MGIRGELFTTQVTLTNRSYFFNVKENRAGDVFLQIVESKKTDGEGDRRAIVVFEEDMRNFLNGMDESLSFIEKERKERAKQRSQKKTERTAKGTKGESFGDETKKVYRRKGESRLVAEKRAEREDDGIKRTGKIIHVKSKRSGAKPEVSTTTEY